MTIPDSEVEAILARPKTVVRPMSWLPKLSRQEPEWLQFESAVSLSDDDDVSPESLRIILTWKPAKAGKAAVSRFGLFYMNERIYAVDCGPDDSHNNKNAGQDRQFYRKQVGGVHEHLWSEVDRDAYAEPLPDDLATDLQKPWQHFANKANLVLTGGFVYPPTQALWKQQGLGIE